MELPRELKYSQLQSKAFFSSFKQWPLEPVSNGGQFFPGQIIRIFFTGLNEGVLDPYRSHLQITVQVSQNQMPVGLLQVDNSAQSFIQQLVITSKNHQIERIIQYGVLAAYLTDIGISQLYSEGRETQGLGYSNLSNYEEVTTRSTNGGIGSGFAVEASTYVNVPFSSSTGCFPTIPPKQVSMSYWGDERLAYSQISGTFRSHINILNSAWTASLQQVWWWYQGTKGVQTECKDTIRTTSIDHYGYCNNIRGQYVSSVLQNDYPDTNTTNAKNTIHVDKSVANGKFPAMFTNSTVYNVSVPQTHPVVVQIKGQDIFSARHMVPNIGPLFGYSSFYSPAFAKGVWQPFISPTVPQCQMMNGLILPQKIPISRRVFKIPLLSSTMGLLIPPQQFVLLPIKAFNDLYLQFTVDPYAMFTSGYNDIGEFDSVGMGLMQQRAFQIVRVVYNIHTYQFYSPQMDQYLKTSLLNGIAINTNYWQMGNQYQIQNSQSITNAWPVACNQQALNEILVLFYPSDYQTLSFCRKHFRISNNITKLQLRINMDYFPTQPLSGHGGNPIQVDSFGSNAIFLEQINLSNGNFFSNLSPCHRINAFNFAVNERPYNIFNTHTLYDPAMIDQIAYPWNGYSVNYDTAFGMSWLHENRMVGKAAYLFTFEPYAHSKNLLNGIDTRMTKTFDIIFGQSPDAPFPRAQTMYIFTRSSNIIEFTQNGIRNINH